MQIEQVIYITSPYLLFSTPRGLHRVVDVLHCSLYDSDSVWPLCLWVDTFVSYDGGYVPEHGLQLGLPLPLRHLQFPFCQYL